MEAPTTNEVLERIASHGLDPRWFAAGGSFPIYRTGDELWVRFYDAETVLKITIEERPRSDWPRAPLPPL